MASRAGVPHTAPHGVMVRDAFPSFPPNKKRKKKLAVTATWIVGRASNQLDICGALDKRLLHWITSIRVLDSNHIAMRPGGDLAPVAISRVGNGFH